MSLPTIQTAVNGGEFSPDLFGRVDLDKYRRSCSTLRNFFASYRGGATSRAGTLFCGFCKQGQLGAAASVPPPRNIPFQFSVTQGIVIEAGDRYFRFLSNGAYITEAPKTVVSMTNGDPGVITVTGHGWSNGDEVFLASVVPQVSNQSFLVINATADTFSLQSPLTGTIINTATFAVYSSGGTAARIYTLATPYAAADVPSLKFAQSADVMSFTHPSYAPYDLTRISAANWTMVKTSFGSHILAPASISLSETDSGLSTPSFYYQFVSTAVDATTGEESIASPVGTVLAVDQATEASTIFINCAGVTGAGSYNFYASGVTYKDPPIPGGIFGYIGSSFGPAFSDTNVVADFTISPPLHSNPFATSSVASITMTAGGASYSPTATTAALSSPLGALKNPVLLPIVVGGAIVWTSVTSGGEGMTGGEAISFIDGTGSGSGATATFTRGASTGTFPSVVAYFQQRRFYANTNNNPDTYFASQPGAFTNMDTSLPVKDDDAIIGSPWSQQVNGIQWMINMPGGLVILTGLGAWQLSGGSGGFATAAAVTPSSQVANPQAYNGVSPTVPPLVINYDILYVQQKGSIVRDLSYNFFVNIYTGTDLTVLSNHLFLNHTIREWAWAEEPYKLIWAVRDDGILLCLTYLKEQDVYSWSRHDTNGLFQSVCSISEPPVNAPYFIVKRLIQNHGNPIWAYCQERMDNRLWHILENAWCVDCGLSLPRSYPNATLTVSSADGTPTLTTPTLIYGGANYGPTTYAQVVDPTGSGAIVTLTLTGGVVTAVSLSGTTTGYTSPKVVVVDPSGAGGGAAISIGTQNLATVSASTAVFANTAGSGAAGDVILMSGRTMQVTAFTSSTALAVNVIRDYGRVIANDPYETPVPAANGEWSISAPTTTVYGLNHLEGMTVSIFADGIVVAPQTVTNGIITLPQPASIVVIGLGFTAQLQTLYLEISGGVTVQGRRKLIDYAVIRVDECVLPFEVGANQQDASTSPNGVMDEPWVNMTQEAVPITVQTPLQPFALYSGDVIAPLSDQLGGDKGQVAIQQTNPTPITVLAVIPWTRLQDDPDL